MDIDDVQKLMKMTEKSITTIFHMEKQLKNVKVLKEDQKRHLILFTNDKHSLAHKHTHTK